MRCYLDDRYNVFVCVCVFYRELPSWKQRIAGKSLPMEKFVIKKSARYFAQNEQLCLPALELIYIWNSTRILGKEWQLIQACYHLIERSLKALERKPKGKLIGPHCMFHKLASNELLFVIFRQVLL